MSEWLNAQNITLALVVLVLLERALQWLAPRTQTQLDDKLLELVGLARTAVTGARSFIRANAGSFWAIVEELKEAGAIKPESRLDLFLGRLEEEYQKATGESFTPEERKLAALEASAISKADKATRPRGEINVGPNETTIGVRLGKALAHLKLARGEKPKVGLSVKF
jgi:hypothetical protein